MNAMLQFDVYSRYINLAEHMSCNSSSLMEAFCCACAALGCLPADFLCECADHFRWQKHMLSLKDHQGNTALHLAVMEGQPESVQLLLQAGANINTPGLLTPSVPMSKQAP